MSVLLRTRTAPATLSLFHLEPRLGFVPRFAHPRHLDYCRDYCGLYVCQRKEGTATVRYVANRVLAYELDNGLPILG